MAWQCGVALLIINSLAIPRYRMAQHGSIWGALTVGALVLEMACFTAGTARSFRPEMDLVGLPLVEFTETSPTALSPTVLIVLVLVDGALAGLALGPWSVSRVVFVLALAVAVQTVAIVWLSGTLLGFRQELGLLKDRRLRHELRTALKQGLLIAHFQPIVRSTHRQVVGYETLVRWTHPRLGLLPAQHFIALAESERLLSSIDRRLIS